MMTALSAISTYAKHLSGEYFKLLLTHPYLSKSITSGAIFMCTDWIC